MTRAVAALLPALALLAGAARAQEPHAPASPAPKASTSEDDFDLLPPVPKPDPEAQAREAETQRALGRRRAMLQAHQAFGIATVLSVGATVVIGQLNYADKYGGGGDTGRYQTAHRIAAYSSTGIFAAAGLLALLAPSPFEKKLRFDTATLHKATMVVATAAMASEIVLGIVTASREGRLSQRDLALAHQIVGYTALVATTAGFVIFAF